MLFDECLRNLKRFALAVLEIIGPLAAYPFFCFYVKDGSDGPDCSFFREQTQVVSLGFDVGVETEVSFREHIQQSSNSLNENLLFGRKQLS
jgi:hypothetical protein